MAETETIYARVPVDVKEAVEVYRTDRGQTLAGAVSELLRTALGAVPTPDRVVWEFAIEVTDGGVTGRVVRSTE
jgi:hypothetical protein